MKKEANWFRWHMCTSDPSYFIHLGSVQSSLTGCLPSTLSPSWWPAIKWPKHVGYQYSIPQGGQAQGKGAEVVDMECSRSLPAFWREHRCWAPLSCCPCMRGLAPLPAALALAKDTAMSSGTNHGQKNKQKLFKKFSLPPLQLSCIIFLTVYSSRI